MSSLAHHGIKGQRWGVRRFQNYDGTRTAAGKKQEKQNRIAKGNEDYRSIISSLSDKDLSLMGYTNDEISSGRKDNFKEKASDSHKNSIHRIIKKDRSGIPVSYANATAWKDYDLERGKGIVDFINVDIATRAGDAYRGKGYAVKSGKQIAQWFDQYGYKDYDHMEWWAMNENVASQKTAEKVGFKRMEFKDNGKDGFTGYSYRSEKQERFHNATVDVLAKVSTKAKPISKEPVDIRGVMDRAKCSEDDAKTCVKLADRVYEKAASEEPRITKDITGIVNKNGFSMYGLEHRLKQPTSMAGKIGSDAKSDGVSYEEASKGIKDAVRYTAVSDNESFVSDYKTLKQGLESKGYEEVKCKNFFEKYRAGEVQHKAVQTTFKSPTGYEFELQFQTPESQAAKELKIPIYEERRKQGISSSRAKELEKQMRDLAERVPYPEGIETIESHNKLKHPSIGGKAMQNQNGGFPLIRHDDYIIIDGAIMSYDTATNYLAHFGRPGQKWGQRWYQYEDGSLTPLGRIHYGYGKSKKDYALAAAWATKEGLKVGAKSVGKAAVSGAKAIANAKRKADEGDFERRKRKAAETAEGVAKNPEYFTNDELKSLNERFNTESQIRDKGAKEHKEKKAYREMIAEEKAREKTQKRLEKDARKKAKEEEKKAKAAKADEKYKKEILAKGPDELLKPENRRLFTNEELEAARVRFDKEAAIRKQVNDKRYEDQQAAITRAKTYIDAADKAFKMAQSGVEFAKKMDEAVYLIKGHHLFNPNDTADRRSKDDKNKDQKNDQQNQPKNNNNNNQPKNNGGGQQGGNNQPKNNPPSGGMQTAPWTPSSNQNGQQNIWNTVSGEDISRASKDVLRGIKKPKYESNANDGLDLSDVQYSVLRGAELLKSLDEIYGKKIKHSDYFIINGSLMSYDMVVSYLEHSGTKGMRWGVRRWQNYDGSLTEAGYKHYGYGMGDRPRKRKQYQKQLNDYDKMKALNKRKIRDVQPDIDYYDGVTAKMQKLMAEGRETKERGEAAIESYKTARARYQKIIDEHKKNIEEIDKKIDLLIKGDIDRPETGLEVTSKATTRNVNNGKEIAGIVGASITFGIPGFAVAYPAFNKEEWGTKYKVKTSEAQKIKESLEDPFERAMYEGYKARANKESTKDFDGDYDEPGVTDWEKTAGTKGQNWGARKYQNEDGSLTEEGVKKFLKQTSETKANINKYKNTVGKDATEARKILESVTSDCIVPDDSFTKASPETKRRLDASAKLGLQALNRMNGNDQWDSNNKDNKNWFIYEDQTLGLATVADMINRGYTSKDVGNLVKTINNNSVGALAIDEKYMDDWYDSKAGAVSFFLTEGDNGKGGLEKFAKACEEVKKEQSKVVGNLSNKTTDRSLKGEKPYNQGDIPDLIKMGYSSTEIARMTGVSESSVRSQRKRAAKHSDIPEYIVVDGYLMHYGVKGQKKGIRQWQNKDGSLTPAGREHYGYGTQKKSAPSMYDIYSGGGGGLDDEEEDDEQETEETPESKSNPVLDFVVSNMTRGLYDTNDVKETVNTYRNKYQSVTGKTESKSEKKPKNEPKVFGSIHIGANQETINLAKERGRQLADAFNKRKDEYFSHLHLVSRTTKRKSK